VPRTIYISPVIATLVYVSIAVAAVGNPPVERLVEAEEYTLAEAARPFLGSLGFTPVSLDALALHELGYQRYAPGASA